MSAGKEGASQRLLWSFGQHDTTIAVVPRRARKTTLTCAGARSHAHGELGVEERALSVQFDGHGVVSDKLTGPPQPADVHSDGGSAKSIMDFKKGPHWN